VHPGYGDPPLGIAEARAPDGGGAAGRRSPVFFADISVPAVVYARMGLGGQRLFEEWKYRLVRSDAYKGIMCELLEKYVHLDKTTRPWTVADPFYQVFESAQSAKGERV
jgi:hypothetical protein